MKPKDKRIELIRTRFIDRVNIHLKKPKNDKAYNKLGCIKLFQEGLKCYNSVIQPKNKATQN
ncbi:unnamed protein product [Paramecium pentaurelia]|uniref:Uncharacterized protein n=1 Tax=Paramecium pentaurelia TaxID=43138 RepID=A0A8S1VSY2_9CILI|nr:unnamed protein product [Paramecium pentaurelia]